MLRVATTQFLEDIVCCDCFAAVNLLKPYSNLLPQVADKHLSLAIVELQESQRIAHNFARRRVSAKRQLAFDELLKLRRDGDLH